MHVLLDECVPREMRSELLDHAVKTVVEMVWASTRNGTLLRRAISEFDVLLTVDQGVPYQQNIESPALALIIVKAPSTDINDLRPKMPELLRVLRGTQPGQVAQVA